MHEMMSSEGESSMPKDKKAVLEALQEIIDHMLTMEGSSMKKDAKEAMPEAMEEASEAPAVDMAEGAEEDYADEKKDFLSGAKKPIFEKSVAVFATPKNPKMAMGPAKKKMKGM